MSGTALPQYKGGKKKRAFVQPGLKRMAIIVLTLRLGVFA